MEDEEAEKYREKYPELNIIQPSYSVIEFDNSVSDDANISNLDNKTGYKYGNTYVMSAHVAAILRIDSVYLPKLQRCLPVVRRLLPAKKWKLIIPMVK